MEETVDGFVDELTYEVILEFICDELTFREINWLLLNDPSPSVDKGGCDLGLRHEDRGVVPPLVSMEDCKVEGKPECCLQTGVERQGEGEKVQVEGGVAVQARPESSRVTGGRGSVCGAQWSDGSSAPVASSSSPEVCEARPCVSSEETAQLSQRKRPCSPPSQQQQWRKKGRVQSAGGDVPVEGREVSHSHSEGLQRNSFPHPQDRAGQEDTTHRYKEVRHEGSKKHVCPHCSHRTAWKHRLQRHIETVHEGLKNHACPHCQYTAGRKDNLQRHIRLLHEG